MKQKYFRLKKAFNSKACSVHHGPTAEQENSEQKVYDCTIKHSEAEIAVFTNAIGSKSLALNPSFKDKDPKSFQHWVYRLFD